MICDSVSLDQMFCIGFTVGAVLAAVIFLYVTGR